MPTNDFELLNQFTFKASADPVKTDLELRCNHCGELLADAEADDTLAALVLLATTHAPECDKMPRGLL